jgi:hypothetical protein
MCQRRAFTVHVNLTSAAYGGFPYFFASGHSSHETGAPRLLTGYTRGVIDTCSDWPDTCIDEYPSVSCFLGTCSVAFEGINIMAMDYLNAGNVRRAGIVMSDFPGHGLIEAIISFDDQCAAGSASTGSSTTGSPKPGASTTPRESCANWERSLATAHRRR